MGQKSLSVQGRIWQRKIAVRKGNDQMDAKAREIQSQHSLACFGLKLKQAVTFL